MKWYGWLAVIAIGVAAIPVSVLLAYGFVEFVRAFFYL